MKKIKAAFFDFDRTIYTHRVHDFIASSKTTLTKLKEAGIKVCLSTSRCENEMQNAPSFFKEFKWDGLIYCGGAHVIRGDEVVFDSPIDNQVVEELIAYTYKEKIPLRYATAHGNFFSTEVPASTKDEFFKLYMCYPIIKPYEQEKVYNILVYPTSALQNTNVMQKFSQLSFIEHGSNALEITQSGIGKHIGVQALINNCGIELDDIACFGDGENDVLMLKAAGIGICPANGCIQAQKAADIVCDDMEQDGIYKICLANEWIKE